MQAEIFMTNQAILLNIISSLILFNHEVTKTPFPTLPAFTVKNTKNTRNLIDEAHTKLTWLPLLPWPQISKAITSGETKFATCTNGTLGRFNINEKCNQNSHCSELRNTVHRDPLN